MALNRDGMQRRKTFDGRQYGPDPTPIDIYPWVAKWAALVRFLVLLSCTRSHGLVQIRHGRHHQTRPHGSTGSI
jgi:hypothetical protein